MIGIIGVGGGLSVHISGGDEVATGIILKEDGSTDGVCDLGDSVVCIIGEVDVSAYGVCNLGQITSRIGKGDCIVILINDP